MVLSPKAQGLRLSTDGLQAHLAQPPNANDVALFLHTSGNSEISCALPRLTGLTAGCPCGAGVV